MAVNNRIKRLEYCRNWPYGEPQVKRAPFDIKCTQTKRTIRRGEYCITFRGYYYTMDSERGRDLLSRTEEMPVDWFA